MQELWDRLRAELVDIIEWSEAVPGAPSPAGDTLAWRFSGGDASRRDSTIRNGAQLIVREGQWAVFLDEGRIADAFGPGRHTLSTANLPLLTALLSLPSGFESPFKAEVVFVCTRLFSNLRWGTRHPLLLRDPELGPVRLRGFGTYTLRVNDPAWLVREVSGASASLSLTALTDPLRNLIVSRLADVLGACDCPVFDLSRRYGTLARDLRLALLEDVQQYGLEIPSLLIEALTLPPEVEAALDRRSTRLVDGSNTPLQAPRAIAARQPRSGPWADPAPDRAPPPPPPPPPSRAGRPAPAAGAEHPAAEAACGPAAAHAAPSRDGGRRIAPAPAAPLLAPGNGARSSPHGSADPMATPGPPLSGPRLIQGGPSPSRGADGAGAGPLPEPVPAARAERPFSPPPQDGAPPPRGPAPEGRDASTRPPLAGAP